MKELAEIVAKETSLCFFVGTTLFFDPLYQFSMQCIQAARKPAFGTENSEGALMKRYEECAERLRHVVSNIHSSASMLQYFGPSGFDSAAIEEMHNALQYLPPERSVIAIEEKLEELMKKR
ncbi:hypothetical protein KY311_05165 [Candidatus Woesearchaeota archaeon]|nr:hypothetical protein [Candidatus Woesearchaeota archaeon]